MNWGSPARTQDYRSQYHRLAQSHDAAGRPRVAGFEIEFTGLTVETAAGLVARVWGGQVEQEKPYAAKIKSDQGTFKVEIDTSILKEEKHQRLLERIGLNPSKEQREIVDSVVSGALSLIVPVEIVTPPLPVDDLDGMDTLCTALAEAQAVGTKASPLFAFGLHINLSVRSLDVQELLADLRAFAILLPWLMAKRGIDFSRRITKYAEAFPPNYLQLILDEGYQPDQQIFIDDYLAFNHTRNRALDLLPVLAVLDDTEVFARAEEQHLVSARAALHIRGPDCRVGEKGWAPSDEWNAWAVAPDRLAARKQDLFDLMKIYRHTLREDERTLPKVMVEVIERDYRWLVEEFHP